MYARKIAQPHNTMLCITMRCEERSGVRSAARPLSSRAVRLLFPRRWVTYEVVLRCCYERGRYAHRFFCAASALPSLVHAHMHLPFTCTRRTRARELRDVTGHGSWVTGRRCNADADVHADADADADVDAHAHAERRRTRRTRRPDEQEQNLHTTTTLPHPHVAAPPGQSPSQSTR
jgi:hypothetical protein